MISRTQAHIKVHTCQYCGGLLRHVSDFDPVPPKTKDGTKLLSEREKHHIPNRIPNNSPIYVCGSVYGWDHKHDCRF